MIEVEIHSDDEPPERLAADIRCLVDVICGGAGFDRGEISVAILGDEEIRVLNRRHLAHDYATDVLSFRLDDQTEAGWIEGEVIVSRETARRQAPNFDWSEHDELLLYVAHGLLHVVGHEDATEAQRRDMRRAEAHALSRIDPRLGTCHALHAQREFGERVS